MQLKTFPFFYHPSSIVMVDDQMSFLQSMVTAINTAADCKGFTHVEGALEYLNNQPPQHPLFADEPAGSGSLIAPKQLLAFLSNKKRFQWVTTVIVDYTMPNMNGLEFCAKVKSPFLRKIMLTGDATLDVAIKAFNQGVIHKFFKKAESDILNEVNAATFDAQLEYFSYRSEYLQQTLPDSIAMPAWAQNSATIDVVIELLKKAGAIEFYLLNEDGDILLFNGKGEAKLLMFRDAQAMDALVREANFAYKNEPDPEMQPILDKLKAHKLILEPIAQGAERVDSLAEWEPCLHPAAVADVEGVQYFHATVSVTKSSALYDILGLSDKIVPYDTFEGAFEVVG